jgi:hypothetical protein
MVTVLWLFKLIPGLYKSKSSYDRLSRPVCPGIRPPSGTHDQIFSLFRGNYSQTFAAFSIIERPLWREDGSVFTRANATEPCQRRHSRAKFPQKLRPYLNDSFETAFLICRHLRFAGLRWRYSNPPPHGGKSPESKSKLSYDRRSIGRSGLVPGHHLGPSTNFSFTSMENILVHLRFSSCVRAWWTRKQRELQRLA